MSTIQKTDIDKWIRENVVSVEREKVTFNPMPLKADIGVALECLAQSLQHKRDPSQNKS